MSEADRCHVCGSADVVGWTYFCKPHDPRTVRERLVRAFATHVQAPDDGPSIDELWAQIAPPGWQRPTLLVGTVARAVFHLGRLYERRNLDALAQRVLESVPGATSTG